jgi:hypothetical protein
MSNEHDSEMSHFHASVERFCSPNEDVRRSDEHFTDFRACLRRTLQRFVTQIEYSRILKRPTFAHLRLGGVGPQWGKVYLSQTKFWER